MLGDFQIANCFVKADRTHGDGKQSHERPRQRRATCDRASGDPNAKGYDTYRDWERECGIHVGLHSKEGSFSLKAAYSKQIETGGIVGAPEARANDVDCHIGSYEERPPGGGQFLEKVPCLSRTNRFGSFRTAGASYVDHIGR
jgi:hypothetical protein